MTVSQHVLEEVLQHFTSNKDLETWGNNMRNVLDRHRAFFVWRRAMTLGNRNPGWILEYDHTSLKNRINSEFVGLESYIATQLRTSAHPGPLLIGHLDLTDLAWRKTTEREDSAAVKTRASRWRRKRYWRCQWIIWRAAALCDDMWSHSPDNEPDDETATLDQDIIKEYLDRRLRVVERMHLNIGKMGMGSWPEVTGVQGPWKDGFRVRVFEYPRINLTKQPLLHKRLPDEFLEQGKYIAEPGTLGLLPMEHDGWIYVDQPDEDHRWVWTYKKSSGARPNGVIKWRVAPFSGGSYAWRLPQCFPGPSMRDDWTAHGSDRVASYRIDLTPASGRTGAQAVDDLFDHQNTEDIWDRPWILCDHVCAACDIEALLFALRRRGGSSEATFNQLVAGENLPEGAEEPYVALDYVVGYASKRILMAHENDRHFENKEIPDANLQVGDHVVFHNHILYQVFYRGPWRLENAYIMRVDSDGRGGIDRKSVRLQGHGIAIKSYSQYQKSTVKPLRRQLDVLRKKIRAKWEENNNVSQILWSDSTIRSTLRRWSPYEYTNTHTVSFVKDVELEFGPWWLEMQPRVVATDEEWREWRDLTTKRFPKTYGHGVGYLKRIADEFRDDYHEPPNTRSAVYFPIFEPPCGYTLVPGREILSGWDAFFERKLRGLTQGLPKLRPVEVDESLIPGFYRKGETELPVVRPLATQATDSNG